MPRINQLLNFVEQIGSLVCQSKHGRARKSPFIMIMQGLMKLLTDISVLENLECGCEVVIKRSNERLCVYGLGDIAGLGCLE